MFFFFTVSWFSGEDQVWRGGGVEEPSRPAQTFAEVRVLQRGGF